MNDATEFSLALSLAKERLSMRIESGTDPASTKFLQYTSDRLEGIAHINICAACFCENPDLLSQWRGYAGGAGGVAIGFSSAALERAIIALQGSLGRCVYDRALQVATIDRLVDDVISGYKADKEAAQNPNFGGYSAQFQQRLIAIGAFFKADGFKEESEWRLVTGAERYGSMSFKVGPSMLVPYCDIPVRGDTWTDQIPSITLGPCPHPKESEQAITGLRFKYGVPPNIIYSKIPFRNW